MTGEQLQDMEAVHSVAGLGMVPESNSARQDPARKAHASRVASSTVHTVQVAGIGRLSYNHTWAVLRMDSTTAMCKMIMGTPDGKLWQSVRLVELNMLAWYAGTGKDEGLLRS